MLKRQGPYAQSLLRSLASSLIKSSAPATLGAKSLLSSSRTVHTPPSEGLSAIETPANAVKADPQDYIQVLPVSHELGEMRRRSLETKGVTIRYTAGARDPQVRTPADSWVEMTYPFSSSPLLQKQYQRFNMNLLRLGMILEDVDGFAGDIAHLHVMDPTTNIVTASVDKITWLQSPPEGSVSLSRDLRFAGQVSWTGRSSLEVLVEAHTRALHDQEWIFAGLARFVMVARDNATGEAVPVGSLQPQTPIQHNLFTMGHYNREVRRRKRESSLNKSAPTTAEIAMLQNLVRKGSTRAKPMASTLKSSVRLMHSQDRNTKGKIYGGYLLREAYELAYACALLHCGETVDPAAIQDVAFLQPVEIGSIVEFQAQVAFVYGSRLLVNVRALCHGVEKVVTNDFTIAFNSRNVVPEPVMPVSIQEGLAYIQGYRQYHQEQEDRFKQSDRFKASQARAPRGEQEL